MEAQQKKKLNFDYRMELTYGDLVHRAFFTIKGVPQSNARQQISDIDITMSPWVDWSEGRDSFGNLQIYGCITEPHDHFIFHISGEAAVGENPWEEAADENLLPLYRYPYGMNRAGSCITEYYESLKEHLAGSPYENAVFLMHQLHRDFQYRQYVTDLTTGAEEAWELGGGVCQDYVHIFLALCHLAGIPARYVTGLITGEGASHAWAEICDRGKWYGLDPTNDIPAGESHVKIGHGRDASDCPINRGILLGGGEQYQKILVTVAEEETIW